MTTELNAVANKMALDNNSDWATRLMLENDDLRRQCERMRKERDELRLLIIQMRKRIADIMHSSLDTVNKL